MPVRMAFAGGCVLVYDRDSVNIQIGAVVISDHHLPGASHPVVSDVVASHPLRKSSPVYIYMFPRLSLIIPHKDGV